VLLVQNLVVPFLSIIFVQSLFRRALGEVGSFLFEELLDSVKVGISYQIKRKQ